MAEFGGHPFYDCRNCLNPLAFQDDHLLSKAYKNTVADNSSFDYGGWLRASSSVRTRRVGLSHVAHSNGATGGTSKDNRKEKSTALSPSLSSDLADNMLVHDTNLIGSDSNVVNSTPSSLGVNKIVEDARTKFGAISKEVVADQTGADVAKANDSAIRMVVDGSSGPSVLSEVLVLSEVSVV
ncbi:hypothetical protein ACOSQ3_031993 [Xanthoceras sorbifolium]